VSVLNVLVPVFQLLSLLKIVLDQRRGSLELTGRQSTFDPKAALFVCNRVDLVQPEELDKVKQNAIGRNWSTLLNKNKLRTHM